jgi:predicted nucleic acid-binding protein
LNVLDSCGWLSYFLSDGNADFFAPVIEDTDRLLVPGLVVYEVSRRLGQLYGPKGQSQGLRYLKLGKLLPGDWAIYADAADAAKKHKLHMADAVIWQTAQANGATLYTQDSAFDGMPGVAYRSKEHGA